MTSLKTQAIQIALSGDWKTAATLNVEILKEDPKDTEALNRLAFALTALGNIKEAKETYERVLEIDTLNPIATRGLKRLNAPGNHSAGIPAKLVSNMFLEESGKTKIVTLVNTAPNKTISHLQVGQTVALCKKRMKIFVQDDDKEYIGVLPDDLGKRLIKFIDGGNQYLAYIKSANDHGVTIFMKEEKRATKFKNQPSFLFGDKTHLALHKTSLKNAQDEDEEESA
ncbi:MAG TPA: tetratricopeptide repeat protein [Candidatus Eisenbacteria bacterium]|nr:tetratricopeptide repeat protein [Candidatus Eisenbacteria bacterium]